MLTFRQLDGHQLIHLPCLFYQFRVLFLAHLTAKLLEIIIGKALHLILLDFGLVPSLETVEVHHGT